jgi:hypothetical protein
MPRLLRIAVLSGLLIAAVQGYQWSTAGPLVVEEVITEEAACPTHGDIAANDHLETHTQQKRPRTSGVLATGKEPGVTAGATEVEAEDTLALMVEELPALTGGTLGARWVDCPNEEQGCTAFVELLDLPGGLDPGVIKRSWRTLRREGALPFALSFSHANEVVFAFGSYETASQEFRDHTHARIASKMMASGVPEEDAMNAAYLSGGIEWQAE